VNSLKTSEEVEVINEGEWAGRLLPAVPVQISGWPVSIAGLEASEKRKTVFLFGFIPQLIFFNSRLVTVSNRLLIISTRLVTTSTEIPILPTVGSRYVKMLRI
jgi:hypothetical protein